MDRFSCYIVGAGTLPIQCAEILSARGHEICGIITPDPSVTRWAVEKEIPHATPTDNLVEFLSRKPFDYLFSIVNEYILPQELFDLPRKYAINYHDAPLPRYAGTHATSWALLNRENTHAVSWHLITDMVDAGDILKQRLVEVAPADTAFTLNTKCYEAAIRSFAEMVDDLLAGRAEPKKQNLEDRTFFARFKRPPAGCLIQWDSSAYEIDALVRALSFGPHPNPLGAARLAIEGSFVVVGEASVEGESSEAAPGTLTQIGRDYISVAAGDREIRLQNLFTIDGKPLAVTDFVAEFNIRKGYRFAVNAETAGRVESFIASSCKHEAFWVKRLATLEPATLPYLATAAAHSKPPRYKNVRMQIPDAVIELLESQPEAWSKTDFLIAAYTAYVARIAGTDHFDIGHRDLVLERDLAGFENLFARRRPLRVSADRLESFARHYDVLRDELQALKKRGAYLRDVFLRYPVLRRCAETDTTSLFQVAVERVERLSDYDAIAGSQISLVIPEHGSECLWVYDGEALDEQSVHTIAKQFTALLRAVAADPNRRVADVALLTEKELHKLIVEWNQTSIEYPKDRCVHELIEAHARRAPDDIAVVFDKQRLTYYELNRKANQLAHHLRKLGVKPETLVAICVERSIEMVIGLLGILKAGGAYVPLDPSYPKERIALMLEDSQAPVLLTQQSLIEKLPAHAGRIVCLGRDWKTFTEEPADDLQSGVGTDRLAYVIYTSGSTGKPKGVAITHDSLLNLVFWHERAYKITSKDRATQIASMGFDACVWELWPYLTAGASIYIPDEVTRLTPIKLRDWLIANEITVCFLPTPLAESIQDLDWPVGSALRYLLTGGDQLRQYPKSTLGFQVVNHYGPTESTVVASCAIADPKYSSERLPSIGRPIANTQIYLLDKHLNPVPIGVPGELYIGGAGLARGYLNRPDLTQEKFVSNPFSRELQARLYRTGDLARYYSDGNLEFLGRSDHQVKIRGFRIELGDIEAALTEHPAVEKCVVIAREDAPGEKRLAAYVVPGREQSPSNDELRSFLKEKLPEHMLPSAYVTLDEIPLTPNGKIDRRALPAPDLSRQQVRNAFVEHRDTIELQLRHIWEQLLRIQPIGVKDDFFELGGHSLLAVRMFNRIEEVFGRVLPLATLLQAPTIEKLAGRLRDEDRSAHWSSLVAIQPEGAKPPLFCIHAGGGNVLFYRDLARHLGPDQPFYALQPQGLDRKRPRHTRVEEMAAHYINEIRTVQVEGPYYLGGACFGGLVALEMAQQLHAQGQEVALLAMFDTNGPGYPKPLPSTRLLRLTRFYSFVRRAEHHWGSLLKMGANDKWEYFLKKTDKARRLLRRNIKNSKKGIARKFYETTGRIIPPGLDKPLYYLLEAQKAYVPQEYPGRITLFRASKQPLGIYHDPAMGWSSLALGGLQIIEAPGYHAGMLSEPRVQVLSEMVKTCLAQARAGEKRAEAFAYSAAS